MKEYFCGFIGMALAAIAAIFGGWDAGLVTLIIFMIIDYAMGILIAAVFKKSDKSDSGALNSKAGWIGLCRKCVTLLFVLIAHRLDLIMNTNYIRDAVVIGFAVNELISIVENAGIMGIPLPKTLLNAVEVLKDKETKP